MASQCHRLLLQSSSLRFSSPFSCSPSSSHCRQLKVDQLSVFSRNHRLQSQRLPQTSISSCSRFLVQCVSSTFDGSSKKENDRQPSNVLSTVIDKASEPIRSFPWAKASNLFFKRLLDQLWIVGKWLAIPLLALSVVNEFTYTLVQEKVLIIPVAMICGIVFSGITREVVLELSPSIEGRQLPWHLIALGILFVVLKLIGPVLPIWAQVSVPHFANGGLWQVAKLVNDWRKQHAESDQ
ncbi:uncharacterized protein [Physcomitrium patens]|uniref:Uncharacterized protein n=1 Tax=Physcomitrium patens TaxID=3218 RepID=A0A2K1IGD3_PHYPA|nr:uncharacterized protein LOC112277018 [Physcomitrium patens]PNR28335.1 hypothetical protein PHYPA_028927 [Physcomitrium patens]|eukprot:XP_024364726.1 uncharacterized protein LOC112277018 [Physcomitrella patens]